MPTAVQRSMTSAQRLAASMESSLHIGLLSPTATACAQRLAASMESSRQNCRRWHTVTDAVLNALRHQWNHHQAGRGTGCFRSLRGAQRLAASMESSPEQQRDSSCRMHRAQRLAASMESSPTRVTDPNTVVDGAQRLAASMESSHLAAYVPLVDASLPRQVLNALRHQWNHHSTLRTALSRSRRVVLNALRHQWNHHTDGSETGRQHHCVLNALRHQWNHHRRFATP